MRPVAWRALPLVVVLAAAALLHLSCKSLGRGVVDGISERRDTLAAAVRPAGRAAVEEMGGAFRDSVQPKLEDAVTAIGQRARPAADSLLDSLLDSLEIRVRRLEDSLTVLVAGKASAGRGGAQALGRDLAGVYQLIFDPRIDASTRREVREVLNLFNQDILGVDVSSPERLGVLIETYERDIGGPERLKQVQKLIEERIAELAVE